MIFEANAPELAYSTLDWRANLNTEQIYDTIVSENSKVVLITDFGLTIPASTFDSNSNLLMFISNSFSIIDEYAFNGCSALQTCLIDECNEIKQFAFSGCYELITFSSNAKFVRNNCFSNCTQLYYISLKYCLDLDNSAFENITCIASLQVPLFLKPFTWLKSVLDNNQDLAANGITWIASLTDKADKLGKEIIVNETINFNEYNVGEAYPTTDTEYTLTKLVAGKDYKLYIENRLGKLISFSGHDIDYIKPIINGFDFKNETVNTINVNNPGCYLISFTCLNSDVNSEHLIAGIQEIDQMFIFTTPEIHDTALKLVGSTNGKTIYVDWGDGMVVTKDLNTTDLLVNHTYSEFLPRTIKIYGNILYIESLGDDITNLQDYKINFKNLPKNLKTLDFKDMIIEFVGDIALLPQDITFLHIAPSEKLTYTSKIWANKMYSVRIEPKTGAGFTSYEIDKIIHDLSLITWFNNGELVLTGSNASRTNASDDDVSTIVSQGVTVVTN